MREAAMHDSRVLNWTRFTDALPPVSETCYCAVQDDNTGEWLIARVQADSARLRYLLHRRDMHVGVYWSPDLLGLPSGA